MTTPIKRYQEKEVIFLEDNSKITKSNESKDSKPSGAAMAAVYEALMKAFAQQQEMEKLDISIVHQSIDQQTATNAKLNELNFNVIPDLDSLISAKHEEYIADLKNFFDKASPGAWEAYEIEKHIRNGTMPTDKEGHAIMEMVRQGWSNRDFLGEARNQMNDRFPHASLENTQITKNRECLNNQLAINQQYSQLGTSYCQTVASRLSQTSSTFTSCLATQKEANDKVWR